MTLVRRLIQLGLSTWQRTLLLAVVLWLVSLVVASTTLNLGNFGAPLPIFLFLFGWLVTLGLPTTLSAVLVTSLWGGGFFEVFLKVVAAIALIFHIVTLWMVKNVARSKWGAKL